MTFLEIYANFVAPALVVAAAYGLVIYDRWQRTRSIAAEKAEANRRQRSSLGMPAE